MDTFVNVKKKFISYIYVTEPKFALLATWQANKSGDELLGQGITTLIGKPADQEDGRLVPQKYHLPSV